MRILAISDIHGNSRALRRILERAGECEIILLAGDLTHFGSPRDADQIISQCRERCPTVYAVAGNCDTAAVADRLRELGVDLGGQGIVLGDLGIQGLGGIPHWRPGMYQFSEAELAEMLEKGWQHVAAAKYRIVLAHVPPRGCAVDRVFWGCHVGSTAVKEFVQTRKPQLVICGHIHEGRGIDADGITQIVNCGHGASGYFAKISLNEDCPSQNKSFRIELCEA